MILVERFRCNEPMKESVFVSVYINERWIKPDLAFQRYSSGKSKPNYPVPAKRAATAKIWYHDSH